MADESARRIPVAADSIESLLAAAPLFKGCERSVLNKVAPHMEPWEFAAKATIVKAGSTGDAMYLLVKGKVSVLSVNAASGASTVVEMLGAGEHFGEIGPLTQMAHSHTFVADEASFVLRIRAELVEQLVAKVPVIGAGLAKRLARRVVALGLQSLRQAAPAIVVADERPSPSFRAGDLALKNSDVIPYVELASYEISPKLIAMVPDKLMQQHRLLPLELRGKTLVVGMVSPRNQAAIAELNRVMGTLTLEVVAIGLDDFAQALVRLKLSAGRGDGRTGTIQPDSLAFDIIDGEREAEKAVRVMGDEVIRFVNRIIAAGLEREASDIHIEPDATGVRVRFRIAGVMQDWTEMIPNSMAKGLVARFKILSGLDITERRLPQDGRIALTVGRREVDLRISTLPASRGEKIVLRVCEAAGMMRPLEQTFLEGNTLAALRRALQRPAGSIIVAGGTGSGKSSTLYSLLNERRKVRPDSNVLMVEDPIEYRVPGITQIQVNAAINLGFAQVLRAALRQDPDVIAVGETRDADTAMLAMEASITGHLMLTSIHASGAFSVIQRLISFGCPSPLIAQALAMVVVQRLVRRLCGCARSDAPAPAVLESLVNAGLIERGANGANIVVPRPVGCDLCRQTGYVGRVAVLETLAATEEVRDAIGSGRNLVEVEKLALASKAFVPFRRYTAFLMERKLIGSSDALLAVTE